MKKIFFTHPAVPYILVILLCIIAYANSMNNEFMLDDYNLFFEQDSLQHLDADFSPFREGFHGFYRPIGFLFLKYSFLLCQSNAFGYHLINLGLFIMICLLFLTLIGRLFNDKRLAFFTTCLYAAHPINAALVNYKTISPSGLNVILMQLSMLFFLRYLKTSNKIMYVFSGGLYFTSLFTHEVSFIFPFYLFLVLQFLKGVEWKRSIMFCLPFVIIFAIYLGIRSQASIGDFRSIGSAFQIDISFGSYLATIAELLFWYISRIFMPMEILLIWDVPIVTSHVALKCFLFVIVLGLCLTFIIKRRNDGLGPFSLSLFLSGISPVFLAAFTYTSLTKTGIIEPHWFYFPSIGVFLCLGQFVLSFYQEMRVYSALKLTFLILAFVTMNIYGNQKWKDEDTYCTFWIKTNPHNEQARNGKARAFIRKNDKGLDKSLYNSCDDVAKIAGAYNIKGNTVTSKKYFLMALDMDNQCLNAYYGLGVLYLNQKNYRMAEMAFLSAIKTNPHFIQAHVRLAETMDHQGKPEEAQKIREHLRNVQK